MAAAARRRIEHFGVPADAKPFATVHQAAARTEIAGPGAVAADDFTIAPGFGIATFPHGFALPYAIDFSKRKLLCTAHIAPHKLLGERALSDTQRALARVVIRVPWASLRQLAPTLKPRIAPVFIFAANTADACSDIPCSGATRFITEPGIIAQFSGAAGRHANVNAETLRLLLRAVVGLFCQVHVPEDAAGPCVFRLRDAEPELLAAFPEATVMRVAAPQGSKAVLF
jgi:hypothetical protein